MMVDLGKGKTFFLNFFSTAVTLTQKFFYADSLLENCEIKLLESFSLPSNISNTKTSTVLPKMKPELIGKNNLEMCYCYITFSK